MRRDVMYPYGVTLRFISDPGHGWAEVPKVLCRGLGLGTDFASRGHWCYLEEDDECSRLQRAADRRGVVLRFDPVEVDDFDQWLDSDAWPTTPEQEDSDAIR